MKKTSNKLETAAVALKASCIAIFTVFVTSVLSFAIFNDPSAACLTGMLTTGALGLAGEFIADRASKRKSLEEREDLMRQATALFRAHPIEELRRYQALFDVYIETACTDYHEWIEAWDEVKKAERDYCHTVTIIDRLATTDRAVWVSPCRDGSGINTGVALAMTEKAFRETEERLHTLSAAKELVDIAVEIGDTVTDSNAVDAALAEEEYRKGLSVLEFFMERQQLAEPVQPEQERTMSEPSQLAVMSEG